MTRTPFWIALFVAILATACGGAGTNTSGDPRVDAALNNPETAVAPDVPSPPPDVPVITADADSPTDAATPVDAAVATDVPAPSDVPVATDTATPPPPDSGMPFDEETCRYLRTHNWIIAGSTSRADTIGCIIDWRTGLGALDLPGGIAAPMGEFTGTCSGNSCIVGECRWINLYPRMASFRAICGSREFSVLNL